MDQRLTIIGLGVNDLKVAESFYINTLGWIKHSSSNDNIIFIQLNGIFLSLYPKDKLAEDAQVSPQGSGFKSFSMAYNTRSKEEVDAIFKEMKEKDVVIIKEPEEVFWGSYIEDPDHNLWEIAFHPFLELDENGNVL